MSRQLQMSTRMSLRETKRLLQLAIPTYRPTRIHLLGEPVPHELLTITDTCEWWCAKVQIWDDSKSPFESIGTQSPHRPELDMTVQWSKHHHEPGLEELAIGMI